MLILTIVLEEEETDKNINLDRYRSHEPKKRHPYLVKMIVYLILTLVLGFFITKYFQQLHKEEQIEKASKDLGIEIEFESE